MPMAMAHSDMIRQDRVRRSLRPALSTMNETRRVEMTSMKPMRTVQYSAGRVLPASCKKTYSQCLVDC